MTSQLPAGYLPYRSSLDRISVPNNTEDLGTHHPDYDYYACMWRQMRDTWAGQEAVKAQTTLYLPATSGMLEDGFPTTEKGVCAYNAYLLRALFHSFVSDAVDNLLGMLWNKPSVYEIPKELEYLLQKATTEGEGLPQLHRSINRQQLITGRLGLLVDLPKGSTLDAPTPYIARYDAERIINWDAGFRGQLQTEQANLVVLDESGPQRTSMFGWDCVNQYRVLILGDPESDEQAGVYRWGVFKQVEGTPVFSMDAMQVATSRGVPFTRIPWTFINAGSTVSAPCYPPLLGLSNLSLAIYRLEADYRQALFMQTQDTLFTKGFTDQGDKPLRTGAGGRIHANTKDGDAKYIGVASQGLPELRTARDNDLKLANSKAGELMDASSRARESGTALEMRIGSKTATMNEIAIAAAEGLQQALRDVGQWVGVKDLNSILVKPNFEFASREFEAMDLKTLVETKMLGGPMSWESIHEWSRKRGGPGKDLSFEQMMKQIEDEGLFEQDLMPKITPLEQAQLDQGDKGLAIQEEAAKNKPAPSVSK